jgi:hypothetical protein
MRWSEAIDGIGFKIIHLDCVIGRRGMTSQLTFFILAKLIILKPIARPAIFDCFDRQINRSGRTQGVPAGFGVV